MGPKAFGMVTLYLFPRVLIIWTDSTCCLKKPSPSLSHGEHADSNLADPI